MKRGYLLVICYLTFLTAGANDTLTRAQIYNFAVGDTFDYKDSTAFDDGGPASFRRISFVRYVVDRVYYSANSDTLTIVRRREYPFPVTYDSLVISSLSSYEILNYSQHIHSAACDSSLLIDTSLVYNGRKINGVAGNCFEQYFNYQFCEGLGKVYSKEGGGSPIDGFGQSIVSLIYYSKGTEHWGTPILNCGSLLHYTPIPEECAVWTDDIYSVYPPIMPNHLGIREQISSGNKIGFQGHTYVEMVYRSYNYLSNYFTPDSVIGYYRNDTINKKALFYAALSDTPYLEYDFNYLCPGPNCLTQVMVGGQLRTKWSNYIEGVGGTVGLVPVKEMSFHPTGTSYVFTWGATFSSFCVCGQMLYSTDSTITCELISGVDEINVSQLSFIFPNPATSSFAIQLSSGPSAETYFQFYDAFGRQVRREEIHSTNTTINRNNLPCGIYFWQMVSGNKVLERGKVVME